ncbi:hypothetical protein [Enterobacteria phage T6]|uniref:Major capsid domain-containing protein n=2 Tax=Tequatrovirus TaxID=10663 RepID=A0A3S7GUI1_9CAUD|nr:putative head morphogenesis protein [Enterobacteria phage T6]YP_010069599.1 hypothetical protein KMC08_gp034 [Escherichia phage vB_EcoM-G28]ELV9617247.1 hypothetical protein [Shigella flexneri]QBO65445.1 hypothetical protein G25403_00033 [Escherichia phage vB_EcoM_G2540-3]WPJ71480.1 hypothetical protein [Escherichia phage vB-Eco-KMB40]AVH85868.1 hypothetical protein G28_00034 [Escherichia phage vB_EcoM-G28]AXN58075.1 hypothetical protein [Enterobacteria phage T6]
MKTYKEFIKEDMVAGDSGGNPENISTGTTSGAVVNKGPEQIPKKKKRNLKKKKSKNVINTLD